MTTAQLIAFAVAVVICAAGVAASAGHFMRPDRRQRLLLWFGLFALIYGVRMFFKQPLVSALGVDRTPAAWVESTLNYLILIPSLLFAQELYGPGWRGAFKWITVAFAFYAAGALVADVIAGKPRFAPDPSNGLLVAVVIALVVGARAGYKPPPFPEWRVLVAGIVVFLLFVINEHAVGKGLVPWRFSAEPLGFLVQLVALAYIAVTRFFSQDRRLAAIDQEMRSAREIQNSILPRELPTVEGVRPAARYLPVAAVAGDFYDVVALDSGALAVLIADVSGHGVPAALIASMVKVAFTSTLHDTQDPGAVLARMNTTLCGMFARSFVTAACVIVRPAERSLRYALAGHPPSLLVQRDTGAVISLDQRGIVLGFTPDATYATASVPLPGNARLVLYTDGVTETPGAGDDLFDIERLTSLAVEERGRTPESFASRVVQALRTYTGSNGTRYDYGEPPKRSAEADTQAYIGFEHDDVTLVVVDIDILGA
jgi:sigma-B regulation protein RsbU (phosphoserine phosphatase)